ncbi:UDP-N-acetylmuramoyl-L-alanine--D-glutamate ligase [soil metagenome]
MTWNLTQFEDKHVVFVGAGKGRAMAGAKQFLERNANIASFSGVDRQKGDQSLDFLADYDEASTIFIKNEAIPGDDMPVPYLTSTQLFFELIGEVGATTVGITGTKGKSTTAALTAHVLKAAGKSVVLAGNIGVSPLLHLDEASSETVFVIELSSYQLSDVTFSPHVSACINLFNDHTDWHGSLDAYWEAKHNIVRFARPDDLFIYNPSFPTLVSWADEASCRTKAIDVNETLDLSQAQLFGDHNRLNALVVREICRELGVSDTEFTEALTSFTPLEHRMQVVATKQDVTYIDDAIGMTPESTLASLIAVTEKFGKVGCLLLGGQDRGYDFTALMQHIADDSIPNLVLFPDTVDKIKAALPEGYTPNIFEATNMADAVSFAQTNAPSNSVVLLSTAAPSYSLWKDFEDKGNQFQAAVSSL